MMAANKVTTIAVLLATTVITATKYNLTKIEIDLACIYGTIHFHNFPDFGRQSLASAAQK